MAEAELAIGRAGLDDVTRTTPRSASTSSRKSTPRPHPGGKIEGTAEISARAEILVALETEATEKRATTPERGSGEAVSW